MHPLTGDLQQLENGLDSESETATPSREASDRPRTSSKDSGAGSKDSAGRRLSVLTFCVHTHELSNNPVT